MMSKRIAPAAGSGSRLAFGESALAMKSLTTPLGSGPARYGHGAVSVVRMLEDGA